MHYYGTRLSENISRREPEGYLLCLNVPVARTGTQDYLPEELGLPGIGPPSCHPEVRNARRKSQWLFLSGERAEAQSKSRGISSDLISVYRPEEEVFSPETLASFEGMPVTNDHPPDGVDIGNIRGLQKGHAHNVRRGTGEESDLLLADLIITDPTLIDLILDGKREISCGYTYELCEENGQYIQRKIRGNHVAVVDAGRAGPRVCIKDEEPSGSRIRVTAPVLQPSIIARQSRSKDGSRRSQEKPNFERSTRIMKKSLSKILARMAKDGDIETVAEIIEEMIEPEGTAEAEAAAVAEEVTEAAEAVAEDPAAVVETPEGATVVVDEDTLAEVITRLDQIITLLTPAATDDDPVEEIAEAVEEALEAVIAEEESILPDEDLPEAATSEEIAEIIEEILDPVSEVLEPAGDECDPEEQEVLSTGDALRAALRTVGPALLQVPEKDRRRLSDRLIAKAKKSSRKGKDAKIYNDIRAAKRSPGNTAALGRRIMAKRNVNCKR